MKQLFFIFLLLGTIFKLSAQDAYNSNLIVFAEDGQNFYLFLNGVRQNLVPQNTVKVTGIPVFYVNLRVVFEDTMIKPIYKKQVAVQDDRGQDLELRYNVLTSPEKQRSLVMAISMPRLVAPKSTPEMLVIPYNNKILPPIVTPSKVNSAETVKPG